MDVPSYSLNDEVEMKRPHPCFARSKRFVIVRDKFNSRLKKVIDKPDSAK